MEDKNFYLVQHSMPHDKRRLERLSIRRDTKLPPSNFLFRIFGKPHFPRGNLVAVKGKDRSGKTLFNFMLIAYCFLYEVLFKAAVQRFRPALLLPDSILDRVLLRHASQGAVTAQLRHRFGTSCSRICGIFSTRSPPS